jgi:hypothetical protein
MIHKCALKVFKILHHGVDNGVIICKAILKYSMNSLTLMSQSTQLHTAMDIGNTAIIDVLIYNNVLHVEDDAYHTSTGIT